MTTLQDYRDRPHWSYSSLNQLLNICSLQYFFERIERAPKAFTPLPLSFGSAFHRCIEWFNMCRKQGVTPGAGETSDLFDELWKRQLEEDENVQYPEGASRETCATQGRDLVACYAQSVDPEEEVVSVNETFAVPLATSEKPLIGEIDLVARKDGRVILADQKTSARRWPKGQAGRSLQPTVYLYGYTHLHPEHLDVPFRFDVVVKNKTPVFEQHCTSRTLDDMRRLSALVRQAEVILEQGVFYPNETSFFCSGCPHQAACKAWHRTAARTISVAA